uniref:Peptidase S1 domain-containing protein n=1 Tax=Panagrolaimus sp. JU765 TaxID=591449 RepID=A0AC34QDD8_9BILA
MICMYKRDSAILQGDSGGPAFAQGKDGKFYQVGINVDMYTSESFSRFSSWELPSELPSTVASISTDVSYYCPWIEETTGGEIKCQIFKPTPIVPKFRKYIDLNFLKMKFFFQFY